METERSEMRFLCATIILSVVLVFAQNNGGETAVRGDTQISASDSAETLMTYIGEEFIVVDSQFAASPAMKYVDASEISDSTITQCHRISFGEILSRDGGLYVKSGQLPLKTSTPMVNGGSLIHQKFLLDGLPVAFPQLQQYDMNYQPLWSVSKIEVVPGSHSGLYGSGGMAGTINFHTQSDFGKGAFTRVEVASGDYGYDWLALKMKHHFLKRVGIYISGTRLATDGVEEEDGTKSENLSAKVAVAIADGWSTEFYAQSHSGKLDYHWYGALCHQNDDVVIGAAHINGKVAGLKLRTSAQMEKYNQQYESGGYEYNHKGDVITGDLRGTFSASVFYPTVFFQLRSYDLSSTTSGDHKYSVFATGIQTEINFLKFSSLLSARVDREISGKMLPSFGVAARYDFFKNFYAALSVGTGFRAPNPNEMWYYAATTYQYPVTDSTGDTTGWTSSTYITRGDENLKDEKSTGISFTTGLKNSRYDITLSGFATFYDDLIASPWTGTIFSSTDGADTFVTFPENISSAKIIGAKIHSALKATDWLDMGISYTFISATDSSGEKLPERPDGYMSALADFHHSIWDDELKFAFRIEPTYTGKIARLKFDEATWTQQLVDMPSVFLLGARASIRYLDFEIFAVGENLTDEIYELPDESESLGRRFRLGIGWDFWD